MLEQMHKLQGKEVLVKEFEIYVCGGGGVDLEGRMGSHLLLLPGPVSATNHWSSQHPISARYPRP